MAENDRFMFFVSHDTIGDRNLQIELRRYSGKYQVRTGIKTDSNLFVFTNWVDLSNARHFIEVDAQPATSSTVADGYVRMWLNGVEVGARTGLQNSKWAQKRVLLGAVRGMVSTTRGTMYFDELEVRTASYIGRAAGETAAPTAAAPTAAPTTAPTAAPTATNPPPTLTPITIPDFIFADGFESGNFSAWDSVSTNNGNLTITTNAALVGSRGLQARIADNNIMRVQKNMSGLIPGLRARFYMHPNGISMAENDRFMIFVSHDTIGDRNLQIELRRYSGKYQVRTGIKTNSNLFVFTNWVDLSNARHFIEVDAQPATSSTVADGYVRMWLNGVEVGARTGLQNSKWAQKRVLLGAVRGMVSTTRGTIYFDELEVRTVSYIGRAAGETAAPTAAAPTAAPTTAPTAAPTATKIPATPTAAPTQAPTSAPTAKPADQIFADSFEGGNLSAWTSAVTNSGSLSVTSAARLVGNRGMQAQINNNNAQYVQNNLTSSQTRYRMRFYFHPNSVQMADGDLFNLYNTYNSSGSTNMMIRMRRSGGNYQLQVAARDNSTWQMTAWYTISNAQQVIEVDWRAASSSSLSNGWVLFYINGTQRTSLALANSNWVVARERLGVVDGVRTGTRGTIYLDHFEARSSTYIGP
jgi:cell division septation protein DedD